MDNELEVLDYALKIEHITLNTPAKDEYVTEIERHIRSIKECLRSIKTTLPYEFLTLSTQFWHICQELQSSEAAQLPKNTGLDLHMSCLHRKYPGLVLVTEPTDGPTQ